MPHMKGNTEATGYPVRVQKVDRPTNRSYYVNLPVVLAEAMGIQKGEQMQWFIEDKDTLLLCRSRRAPSRELHARP